jgi:hypothetical protein
MGKNKTPIKNDWRYQKQERYLKDLVFSRLQYNPAGDNDHDHCVFCSKKFSLIINGSLTEGWTDEKRYHWICNDCFQDFAKDLGLKSH